MFQKTIPGVLYTLMYFNHFTQAQVAKEIGIAQSTVSEILNGKPLNMETANKIGAYLSHKSLQIDGATLFGLTSVNKKIRKESRNHVIAALIHRTWVS